MIEKNHENFHAIFFFFYKFMNILKILYYCTENKFMIDHDNVTFEKL